MRTYVFTPPSPPPSVTDPLSLSLSLSLSLPLKHRSLSWLIHLLASGKT